MRSGFTPVTARPVAQPPKAAFVTRLRHGQLPGRAARQLPDRSTPIWVDSSSTGHPRPRGAQVNLKGIIDLWIAYDSNAGFGKFERQSTETEQLASIRLRHGFLTAILSFQDSNKSLCNFMTGYLNGVLSTLPSDIIKDAGYKTGRLLVSHDVTSEYCVCTNKNQLLGCTWKVTECSS